MSSAEIVYWDEEDQWILGEDQNGVFWVPFVPSDMRPHWEEFSRWNPLHGICYWNSRRKNRVVHLDWDAAQSVADPAAWSRP